MTLDEILRGARELIAANEHAYVEPNSLALAHVLVDTLGAPLPCGYDQPRAVEDKVDAPNVYRLVEWDGATYTRDEALGIAAALIRAALSLPEEVG